MTSLIPSLVSRTLHTPNLLSCPITEINLACPWAWTPGLSKPRDFPQSPPYPTLNVQITSFYSGWPSLPVAFFKPDAIQSSCQVCCLVKILDSDFPLSDDQKKKLDFQMPTAGARLQPGSGNLRGRQPASLAWPGLPALPTPGKRLSEAHCYALPFPPVWEGKQQ